MNMDKKLKVTILYETWGDEEREEAEAVAEPEKKKRSAGKRKKKKREKHDREEIFEALEELGHEPSYQVLDGGDKSLTALSRCDADLFFNLVESYAGDDTKETPVPPYPHLSGRFYPPAPPQALYLP